MLLIPFIKCPRAIGSAGSHGDANVGVQVFSTMCKPKWWCFGDTGSAFRRSSCCSESTEKSETGCRLQTGNTFILMYQPTLTVTAFYSSSEPSWSLLHLVSLLLMKIPKHISPRPQTQPGHSRSFRTSQHCWQTRWGWGVVLLAHQQGSSVGLISCQQGRGRVRGQFLQRWRAASSPEIYGVEAERRFWNSDIRKLRWHY